MYIYLYQFQKYINDTLFIIGDNIDIKNIGYDLKSLIILDSSIRINKFERLQIALGLTPKKYKTLINFSRGENCRFFFGHDHLTFSQLFMNNKEAYLIEDGTRNYDKTEHITKKQKFKLLKKMLGVYYIPFGFSSKVKKIFLVGDAEVDPHLDKKVKRIDSHLFHLFLKQSYTNRDVEVPDKCAVILTQPLSEDGIISEAAKINIYTCIYHSLANEYNVIIKPHPRDTADYSEITKIIPKDILADYLVYNQKISLIISLFSTLTVKDKAYDNAVNLVSLGTLFDEALCAKFGRIKISNKNFSYILDNLRSNGTDLSETSCHSKGLLKRNRL